MVIDFEFFFLVWLIAEREYSFPFHVFLGKLQNDANPLLKNCFFRSDFGLETQKRVVSATLKKVTLEVRR